MTSIITNLSSMSALQTLKGINKSLNMVQGEVSSGLKIANAKDNASVWAIAATMRSDVSSFKQINDGLGTALAAVNVGRNATETITDLLTQMRAKIVAASTVSTDSVKTQTDIDNLVAQIESVVSAASFNGVNFVNSAAGAEVLTSTDRTTGTVATEAVYLAIGGVDLTTGAAVATRAGALASVTDTTNTATGDMLVAFTMDGGGAAANVEQVTINTATVLLGDRFEVTIGSKTASYTVTQADLDATTPADVIAVKLKSAIDALNIVGVDIDYDAGTPGTLAFGNDGDAAAVAQNVAFRIVPVNANNMSALTGLDVSSKANRIVALATVDAAMDSVIAAAAELGSNQKRLEIQQEFITKLSDSLTIGIGALVDADMEEASARLAALQTQQQLGIQSLSIANQSPQSIMALFR